MTLIKFSVSIPQSTRRGIATSGTAELRIDPATLEQADRDLLAKYMQPNGVINRVAPEPTLAGILEELRGIEAKHQAEEAALRQKWSSCPVNELIGWGYGSSLKIYDEVFLYAPHRMEEAQAELARREAERAEKRAAEEAAAAERKRQYAEAEAEKAAKRAAATERMRVWAAEHGSELTKARLEEGSDCWYSSAGDDFEAIRLAEILAACPLVQEEDGELHEAAEVTECESLKCPSLAEIQAIRQVRAALRDGESAEWQRLTYSANSEHDDDETTIQNEIVVEIRLPDGSTESKFLILANLKTQG